ncbi:unnamed protein product, partial [Iphiclides podalirius]
MTYHYSKYSQHSPKNRAPTNAVAIGTQLSTPTKDGNCVSNLVSCNLTSLRSRARRGRKKFNKPNLKRKLNKHQPRSICLSRAASKSFAETSNGRGDSVAPLTCAPVGYSGREQSSHVRRCSRLRAEYFFQCTHGGTGARVDACTARAFGIV